MLACETWLANDFLTRRGYKPGPCCGHDPDACPPHREEQPMSDPSTLPEWVEHCRTQATAWQAGAERARLNAAEFRDTAGGTLGDLARAARVDLAAEWDAEADRATSYADARLATHRLLSAASRRWPAVVAGDDALAECAGQLAAHLPTAPEGEPT